MIVLPNGKILDAKCMYWADSKNNDARILEDMLQEPNGLSSFLKRGDQMILDRGFRDIIRKLERNYGFKTHMPALLNTKGNKTQFTTKDANATRKVTMVRWVVESANGRIKNVFKLFDRVIPAKYFLEDTDEKLGGYFRVACAILNAYFPPLFVDQGRHEEIIEEINTRTENNNTLLRELKAKNMYRSKANWKEASAELVPNFPRLTEADLFALTQGTYQIRNAKGYIKEHFQDNGDFKLQLHQELSNMIRVKVQSRYQRGHRHDVWIEYVPEANDMKIQRYYCTCKVGSRTLGCCSHVAASVWYLGFSRHQPDHQMPPSYGSQILDALEVRQNIEQSEENIESEDEDELETEPEDLPSDDEFYTNHFRTVGILEFEQDNVASELLDGNEVMLETVNESLYNTYGCSISDASERDASPGSVSGEEPVSVASDEVMDGTANELMDASVDEVVDEAMDEATDVRVDEVIDEVLDGASEYGIYEEDDALMKGVVDEVLDKTSEEGLVGASDEVLDGASDDLLDGSSEEVIDGAAEELLPVAAEELFPVVAEEVTPGVVENVLQQAAAQAIPATRKTRSGRSITVPDRLICSISASFKRTK